MSLEELTSLMIVADLFTDTFGAREVGIFFNLAMMTNVDELT